MAHNQPSRTVVIASGSTPSKGGGVLFVKSNSTGRKYYKFYCAASRFGSMHTSYFQEQLGTNALRHFQHYLQENDAVSFLIDKTAYINFSPNSEFSKTLQSIKKTYGIDISVNIMSKIEDLYLQAADFIANDRIQDAHACMKSFGAEHCP